MYTDASKTGWGAACGDHTSHGQWSAEEAADHINLLELKAAYYGLRSFTNEVVGQNILLRIDNTTAMHYINRMGGIQFPKLNSITRQIWKFCEDRKNSLFATYIPSADNTVADWESRRTDYEAEWSLSKVHFRSICFQFGTPKIDLFASYCNTKCTKFVSWKPDPYSTTVDAFTINWHNLEFYCFPPFALILRCIRKIIIDKAEGILVVPFWPSQSWFPLFERILTKPYLSLGPDTNLLSVGDRLHPLRHQLILVAGLVSGRR